MSCLSCSVRCFYFLPPTSVTRYRANPSTPLYTYFYEYRSCCVPVRVRILHLALGRKPRARAASKPDLGHWSLSLSCYFSSCCGARGSSLLPLTTVKTGRAATKEVQDGPLEGITYTSICKQADELQHMQQYLQKCWLCLD